MFEHQISITSQTGVGSTSLFKALKVKLEGQPYLWVSGGSLMRERAEQCGFGKDINAFTRHVLEHPEEGHDEWLDRRIAELAQNDWMICESRLSHFFMPEAFKVLLECDSTIRAERRQKDESDKTVEQVLRGIEERDENDKARYTTLYPGCIWEKDQYDLVLSTELLFPQEVAELLLREHARWVKRFQRLSHR